MCTSETRVPDEQPSRGWRDIAALVRPERRRVAVLSVASLAGGALEACVLLVVTRAALAVTDAQDDLVILGRSVPIWVALLGAAALLCLRLLMGLLGVKVSTELTVNMSTSVRERLSDAYLSAAWEVQQFEPSGQLQQLLTTFTTSVTVLVANFAGAVAAGLNLAALVAAAMLIDFRSSAMVVVLLALLGSVLIPLRKRVRQRSAAMSAQQLRFSQAVAELGSLALEMRAFGVGDKFSQRISGLIRQEAESRRKAENLRDSVGHIYNFMAFGAMISAICLIWLSGVNNFTTLGAVMLVMLRSLSYAQGLQRNLAFVHNNLPFLDELHGTVQRYESARAATGTAEIEHVNSIEFQDVCFEYVPGRPILRDISFKIPRGQVVGIIGPSGAGKSTLLELLLALREPTRGSIKFSGEEVGGLANGSLRTLTAFVPQEPLLTTGTVADNLRFFRDGIDIDDMERAAESAGMRDEIALLPLRFEQHLGERGQGLSGGQRQRLSIARALCKSPELLILDEPTAALDVHTEATIRDTVGALRGHATVIMVSHRLATLEACDQIIVIEDGRVTAYGPLDVVRQENHFLKHAYEVSGIS